MADQALPEAREAGSGQADSQGVVAVTTEGWQMRDAMLIVGGISVFAGVLALIVCQSVHWFVFGWPMVR